MEESGGGIVALLMNCVVLILVIVMIAGMWKAFEKAGQPGWAAIVPIYNLWILVTEVAKKEVLWFVLFLIPCANIVAAAVVSMDVAERFGKSRGWGIGMLFILGVVGWPMLGFGDAQYQGGDIQKSA